MKLKELRNTNPDEELLKIEFSETVNIWVSDYWDGAISGLLEYQKEFYWFEMTQENEEWEKGEWYRRFAVLELSPKQLEKEFIIHEDFQRFVGTHYDGKQLKPPPKFEEGQMDKFYDMHLEYVRSKPYEENKVIGWMEN